MTRGNAGGSRWRQSDAQLNLINTNVLGDFAGDKGPRKFSCSRRASFSASNWPCLRNGVISAILREREDPLTREGAEKPGGGGRKCRFDVCLRSSRDRRAVASTTISFNFPPTREKQTRAKNPRLSLAQSSVHAHNGTARAFLTLGILKRPREIREPRFPLRADNCRFLAVKCWPLLFGCCGSCEDPGGPGSRIL